MCMSVDPHLDLDTTWSSVWYGLGDYSYLCLIMHMVMYA